MIGQMGIVGLGLIGGSIAAGVKARGLSNTIVAVDNSAAELEGGLQAGFIDAGSATFTEAFLASDLIIVCVPVQSSEAVFSELATSQAVITDVGSVKQPVIKAATSRLNNLTRFVPGHPIAGSEKHGVSAANPDLFEHRKLILTPDEDTDTAAISLVTALWKGLGSDVVTMSAAHHDSVLAQTSHLPHLLAYALVDLLAQQGDSLEIFEYAAGGFRDFSRIAASDPVMWRDIFDSNRAELLPMLDQYMEALGVLRHLLDQGDMSAVHEVLARAKIARDHFAVLDASRKLS